ncbi:MAG: 2-oxo acid dehydrogenase subunit E2 [Candidatus Dadabacteria bacterium]|nr:MAG: 2-oxo acid dehydrogenase subunit E2 [Candidatus Dadabacteria bacterium]
MPENETADVGQVIAYLGEPGEEVPASITDRRAAKDAEEKQKSVMSSSEQAEQKASKKPAAEVAHIDSTTGRIKASPLAKKLAAQHGIALESLKGSGPNGRIVRKDVEIAISSRSEAPLAATNRFEPLSTETQPSARGAQAPASTVAGSLTPFSKMRETIAKRMQQSVTESPHFYTTTSVEMSAVLELRKILKEQDDYSKVSVNHFVIKAAGYGLKHEPRVNRAVRDNQIYQPAQINIGIITALEDGLLIPVIKEADRLPFKDLVFEARAAVERARAGRPNSTDLSGGTFSISNMGMFDVENFTAIINPGQGAVLAVSSIRQKPIVRNGQIVVGNVMKVTLSVDHRIIDGIMSAQFLKHFKMALENPALLMI